MIQLDNRNGHSIDVIKNFNNISRLFDDVEILRIILEKWSDDGDILDITESLESTLHALDSDGNHIQIGDLVVVLDDVSLVGDPPRRGEVLEVTRIADQDSNYIELDNKYGFFAYRVLKIKRHER
jgi:hypothetical protein